MCIKKILKICLLLLASVSMTYGGEKPNLSESRRSKVINPFKEKEHGLSRSAKVTKSIKPDSKFAEWILFIESKSGCPVVAKVFKDLNRYKTELEDLKKLPDINKLYKGLVNKLGEECNPDLPILMEYIESAEVEYTEGTEKTGVVLLSKAKGEPLKDILDNINKYDLEKIAEIFKNTGKQFGELDSLFYKNNKGELLIHPDSHAGNFTYDAESKRLYWIDTAGMTFSYQPPNLIRFGFLESDLYFPILLVSRVLIGKTQGIPEQYKNAINKLQQNSIPENVERLHKLVLAVKSLFDGYIGQLRKNSLDTKNVIEFYTTGDMFGAKSSFIYFIKEVNKMLDAENKKSQQNLDPIQEHEYTLATVGNK